MRDECLILTDSPGALVHLCGISLLERLLRTLQRCELKRAIILSAMPDLIAEHLAWHSRPREHISTIVCGRSSGPVILEQIIKVWPSADTGTDNNLLVLPADVVFDSRLLRALSAQDLTTALVDSAPPTDLEPLVFLAPKMKKGHFCGAAVLSFNWASHQSGSLDEALRKSLDNGSVRALDAAAQPSYSLEMRRELRPVWFPAPPADQRKFAERVLLRATQKGTQDLPAWAHAPIENLLIARLCKISISPNQLTIITNIVAWIATFFFATGNLIWGIVIALCVGVLDGLDGKLARLKVETTKQGELEHWFDALFEWSWWIALAYWFQTSGQLSGAFRYLGLLAIAEAIDGILKWIAYAKTGKLIDELGTFERIVRLVGGRRNIYVWMLTVGLLLGAPERAFMAMAWLEAATAAVHLPHVVWMLFLRRNRFPTGEASETDVLEP